MTTKKETEVKKKVGAKQVPLSDCVKGFQNRIGSGAEPSKAPAKPKPVKG